jgi:hypothetical protein
MKSRILFLCTGLFILILSACEKNNPKASFTVNSTSPEAFDTVFFTNTSENAVKYEWDFGDQETSTEKNPEHLYYDPGTVDVTLKVWNADDEMASTKKTLTITDPTLMGIYFSLQGTSTPVADCPVLVFLTENDLINIENAVDGAMTDADGLVVFKGKPRKYYVLAFKAVTGGYLTNYNLNYVTGTLVEHEANVYEMAVELIAGKKAGKITECYNKLSYPLKDVKMSVPIYK